MTLECLNGGIHKMLRAKTPANALSKSKTQEADKPPCPLKACGSITPHETLCDIHITADARMAPKEQPLQQHCAEFFFQFAFQHLARRAEREGLDKDNIIGSASKRDVHIFEGSTPRGRLHRAFSVFLFDSQNRLLLQQRAASKVTFPQVCHRHSRAAK